MDYTDHIIIDVLLNGISDSDIRRELISDRAIYTKPMNDVIALMESREMARNILPSSMSPVSTFRQRRSAPSAPVTRPGQDLAKQAQCPDCQKQYNLLTH